MGKSKAQQTPGERSSARMRLYLWLALALGLVFAIGVPVLFQLMHALSPPLYTELSAAGEAGPSPQELHRVFVSGEPHVVFCTDALGTAVPRGVRRVAEAAEAARVEAEQSTSSTLDTEEDWSDEGDYTALTKEERAFIRREGSISSPLSPVRVVTLDCDMPLPASGMTVQERFNLPEPPAVAGAPVAGGALANAAAAAARTPPALFIAHGARPRWLPAELLAKPDAKVGKAVLDHVRAPRRQQRTQAIQSDKFLSRDCLSRRHCALLLHDGTSGLESPALVASVRALHRSLPFLHVATLDTRKYTLSLQRNLGALDKDANERGPHKGKKWPRMLYFRRASNGTAAATATVEDDEEGMTKARASAKSSSSPSSVLFVKSHRGALTPLQSVRFVRAHADVPSFPTTMAEGTAAQEHSPSDKAKGLRAMTPLPAAVRPRLRNGVNNFGGQKSASQPSATGKDAAKAQAQRRSGGAAAAATSSSSSRSKSSASSSSAKSSASSNSKRGSKASTASASASASATAAARKEEAARAARIRAQMDAEEAEYNTVRAREVDDDGEEPTGRAEDEEGNDAAEAEDEEAVSRDEDGEDEAIALEDDDVL